MPQRNGQVRDDAVDRLRNQPKTWANIVMAGICIVVFLLVEATGGSDDVMHMLNWGAAYPPLIQKGEYYRLLTSMFLHFSLEHLFNNMLLLIFIGDCVERTVGKIRYLLIYLLGGLGGNLLSFAISLRTEDFAVSAGASGAVFALIGALIWLVLRNKGQLEGISLQRLLLMAALSIYGGFTSTGIDNAAHIGGLVCGFLIAAVVYRKKEI